MKVFISWSGELSKSYAEVLKNWLPCVLQAVRPYFSASDIDKGSRWASEISKELESSAVGVICLTRENLSAPWIMFEAGALTKALSASKVTPLLFDGLSPTDIQGPLSQFQSAIFSKNEIKKLIHSLNKSLGQSALDAGMLDETIEMWWPNLADAIDSMPTDKLSEDEFYQRDERSLLKETLQLVRAIYYQDGRYEAIDPILLRPIDDLELSSNCEKTIKGENIYYIGDLVQLTDIDLIKMPRVSKKILIEVKNALAAKGLSLGIALQNWPPKSISDGNEK